MTGGLFVCVVASSPACARWATAPPLDDLLRTTHAGAGAPAAAAPRVVASPPAATASEPEPAPGPEALAKASPPDAPEEPRLPSPLPRNTTVLHIGDSMAEALGLALKDELAKSDIKLVLRAKAGSYIPEWAGQRLDVKGMVRDIKPDLVIITLGGNELYIREPETRADAVRRLVAKLGGRPCVWVAPALWSDDTNAILEVVKQNLHPCRYFDTNALVPPLERVGDKIHPTYPARRVWAETMLDWLARERDPNGPVPWQLRAPAIEVTRVTSVAADGPPSLVSHP